jgi:hypothetical protein
MAFPNLAGKSCDAECEAELTAAGIKVEKMPECVRDRWNGEVKTIVLGTLYGWSFTRAWYYWITKGPGLPLEYAVPLYRTYGQEVRVNGHCGCPNPFYQGGTAVDSYHIDTPEGLWALAWTIKQAVKDAREKWPEEYEQHEQFMGEK